MPIKLKRAYEPATPRDGHRVLVDRLWPRGRSKDQLQIDEWLKEVAPSDKLRRWFHQDESRWSEFRRRYLSELKTHRETLRKLAARAEQERITLIFSATNADHNNAVVLKQYLRMLSRD